MMTRQKKSNRFVVMLIVFCAVCVCFVQPSLAGVRIKEIAHFEGARDNQLMGYGIVVGLNGTGDKGKSAFTVRGLASMLQRMGLKINSSEISVKNAAAVMVTATLPPFVKSGTKIDVTLSSLGDAKSLAGGILLQTPLQGANGKVYAVAQGSVSLGGLESGTQSGSFNTVARIPDGALVEAEVPVQMVREGSLNLLLAENDFTTCTRMAEAINREFGEVIAYAHDGGSVLVKLPALFERDVVKFIAKIERIEIVPDYRSKIIINERTGTIVGGREVKIESVSLTHLNINIQVEAKKEEVSKQEQITNSIVKLSQYNEALFNEGAEEAQETTIANAISVGELVKYLNSLGVGPKDMIAILHGIKAANAIQADIEII